MINNMICVLSVWVH